MKKKLLCFFLVLISVLFIGNLLKLQAAQLKILIVIKNSPPSETQEDYMDDNKLIFKNRDSLDFLAEALLTSSIEDVTNCSLATRPTPAFFVGDKKIGDQVSFFVTLVNRSYILFPDNEHSQILQGYTDYLIEEGSFPGIKNYINLK